MYDEHAKEICDDEIEVCAQLMRIILHSIIHTTRRKLKRKMKKKSSFDLLQTLHQVYSHFET
jgi:hypothetical protein